MKNKWVMEKVVMQWWGLRELILLVTIKRVSRGASPPPKLFICKGEVKKGMLVRSY